MSLAIVFIGQICSGKSTLAKYYCNAHHWSQISFGSYIKDLAEKKQIDPNRQNLQQIGYEVFKNTRPRDFLINVINFNQPKSGIHVYDSIRHLDILSEVKNHYKKTIVFYLDVDENIIHKRYIQKYDKNIPHYDFIKIIEHPIEKGIKNMKTISDYVLDANNNTENVIEEVNTILNNNKIIG